MSLGIVIPLVVLIGFMIKLDSRGPIFFAHKRYGLFGKPFLMLKFRTMVANSAKLKAGLAELNDAEWPDFKIKNDPRVTRLGKLLRRTSLDELPQLLNVLSGKMSLIGPRASSVPIEKYLPEQLPRLTVLPGIAGPAQVAARHASFEKRCKLEIEYLNNYSLWLDVKLLCKVVVIAVFSPTGW